MDNIIDRNDIEGFFKVITGKTYGVYSDGSHGKFFLQSATRSAKTKGYDVTENDVAAFLTGTHLPGVIPVTPGREDFHEIPATDVVAEDKKSAEALGLKPVADKPLNKYQREIKPDVIVDVYDVLAAWNVTDPAIAHAIKKLLQPGARGVKSVRQDVEEAIVSLERARELPFVGKCTTTV